MAGPVLLTLSLAIVDVLAAEQEEKKKQAEVPA
jgi:hypothetical protein